MLVQLVLARLGILESEFFSYTLNESSSSLCRPVYNASQVKASSVRQAQ